jgi:hypothetical protein
LVEIPQIETIKKFSQEWKNNSQKRFWSKVKDFQHYISTIKFFLPIPTHHNIQPIKITHQIRSDTTKRQVFRNIILENKPMKRK